MIRKSDRFGLHSMSILPSLDMLAAERAWIEIDTAAIAHNIRALQSLLKPETDLLAVVKADAYGHGAVKVAALAEQLEVQFFGVATVPEGIELRQAGIRGSILVMGAVQSRAQIEAIAQWHLEPTLCNPSQAQCFSDALSAPLPVHLKIDTGMSRLGYPWEQCADFMQKVMALPHLHIASVYSHLATADDPDPSFMKEQQARFEAAIGRSRAAGIPIPPLHLANSAATLFSPAMHYDRVRVGLSLYGIYPGPQFEAAIALKPAMQVRARIAQIRNLPAGVGISYGHRFVTSTPCCVAVVSIGYADGVPRNLSNRMQVLVQGQRVPQIGTITMDQIVIDISAVPNAAVGDRVTLLGQDGDQVILAEEWSQLLETIPYEIVCGFQRRLPRVEAYGGAMDAGPG
jgi:alanine racemase